LHTGGRGRDRAHLEIYEHLDRNVIGHPEVISHARSLTAFGCTKARPSPWCGTMPRALLSCERVVLKRSSAAQRHRNYYRKYVDAINGTKARILDTRKTAPGLRVLDKYAVRCGGGQNHRLDLSDGVLSRTTYCAGRRRGCGVAKKRSHRRESSLSKSKCGRWPSWMKPLANGAESILLDNMKVEDVRQAVQRVTSHSRRGFDRSFRRHSPGDVRDYAETGVDYISVGALTHSPQAVDLSMRIVPA